LQSHVSEAAAKATERVEMSLFDAGELRLTGNERSICKQLDKDPKHIEQIIAETDLLPGAVNAALLTLRLKGLVKQLPGSMFIKN